MPLLVLPGSTRSGSYSLRVAQQLASAGAATLSRPLDALPFFSQDREADPPAVVRRLRDDVAAADLVAVVTPEYNGTYPGMVANAIDWLSRPYRAGALRGKRVLVVTASPGAGGGSRAGSALRSVLANVGAEVQDPILSVPQVHTRFGADGAADPGLVSQLEELLAAAGAVTLAPAA